MHWDRYDPVEEIGKQFKALQEYQDRGDKTGLEKVLSLLCKECEVMGKSPEYMRRGLNVTKTELEEALATGELGIVEDYITSALELATFKSVDFSIFELLLAQIERLQDLETISRCIKAFKENIWERLADESFESPRLERYTWYLLRLADVVAKLGDAKRARTLFYEAFNDYRVIYDGAANIKFPKRRKCWENEYLPMGNRWVQVFFEESDLYLRLKEKSYHRIYLLGEFSHLKTLYQEDPFFLFERPRSSHG
ncbi:MAG: hypothetical protein HWN65_15255, partial [Candidatus Helarchaeota archaeon]|nr:hypothetical protein [Candidatus Helarchaeota archaeon]